MNEKKIGQIRILAKQLSISSDMLKKIYTTSTGKKKILAEFKKRGIK